MKYECKLTSHSVPSTPAQPAVLVIDDELESKHGACLDVDGKTKVEMPPPLVLRSSNRRGSAASCRSRMKREVMMAVSLHRRGGNDGYGERRTGR